MAKYKLISEGVLNRELNARIPNCGGNMDWQEYLAWLKEGNKPDPEFTTEEIEEQKWTEIIEERDVEIAATDHFCFADVWEDFTPGERWQIKSFRNALRSIEKDSKVDPKEIVFPEIPDILKAKIQERKSG